MNDERKKEDGGRKEPRIHIRLDEKRFVKTIEKPKKHFRPEYVTTPIANHKKYLSDKFTASANVSKGRRKIYSDNDIYLKLSLTNNVGASNQLLNKFGFKVLRVIEDKKAIVTFSDNDLNELNTNLETDEVNSYFLQIENVEPLKMEEKISGAVKTILSKKSGNDLIDTEIEFFRNLDGKKYESIIEAVKSFLIKNKGELLSKLLDTNYCRLEAKIKVSSINELASGIEPIEHISEVDKFKVGISKIQRIEKKLPEGETEKHPTNDANTVCVIDTGIQKDNFYLKNIVADEHIDYTGSDSFIDGVGHGTFIAGLIAYGDLSRTPIPLPDIKIISAKILNSREEIIPNFEDKLTEIVSTFFKKTKSV